MAARNNKPKLEHIINTGVNEKGEIQKNQKIAIRTADSIFNSPSRAAAGTKKRK